MANNPTVGRFRIVDKIGDGGVGSVFKAIDTRLGRLVAVKFLHDRWRDCRTLKARFRREALIAASLNHPNICTVYDFEEVDGRLFIVMELLRGRTLSGCLRQGGMAAPEVLEVGRQIAGALAVAHDSGIVHRDVKPANVFLGDDGVIKLLDFGVAKPADEAAVATAPEHETDPGSDTGNGRLVGTVGYMSPEQTRGDAIDGRSDLFSLGVVLYEAATGVHPFDGPSSSTVFDLLFSFDPPPPTCLNRCLPMSFNRIVQRALCKTPEARYQSARELRSDLEGVEGASPARELPEAPARQHLIQALRPAAV